MDAVCAVVRDMNDGDVVYFCVREPNFTKALPKSSKYYSRVGNVCYFWEKNQVDVNDETNPVLVVSKSEGSFLTEVRFDGVSHYDSTQDGVQDRINGFVLDFDEYRDPTRP